VQGGSVRSKLASSRPTTDDFCSLAMVVIDLRVASSTYRGIYTVYANG
jgi:hypothetical protein